MIGIQLHGHKGHVKVFYTTYRLLNKPARKHSHWKDKPEPRMEQGKCKEALHQEVETLHP